MWFFPYGNSLSYLRSRWWAPPEMFSATSDELRDFRTWRWETWLALGSLKVYCLNQTLTPPLAHGSRSPLEKIMLLAEERTENKKSLEDAELQTRLKPNSWKEKNKMWSDRLVVHLRRVQEVLKRTVPPELDFEPAWSWNHTPALGAVNLPVLLSEGHRRKHVGHVVAIEAQLNLGACLQVHTTRKWVY